MFKSIGARLAPALGLLSSFASCAALGCGSPETTDAAASTSTRTDASAPSGSGGDGRDAGDAAIAADAGSDGAQAYHGTCPSPPRPDPMLPLRELCTFTKGDRTLETLGHEPASIPIKHVIVLMKENRSFDHIFGGLGASRPDVDVANTAFVNKDASGASVPFFHQTSTCVGFDPDHQWAAMHAQVNGGKMDGFVKSAAASTGGDGHFVMGHYEESDLPFYYFLANTFALADHHFPSVRSGTFPNRDYLLLGTSDKVTATEYQVWPDPGLPTLFDELTAAGVSWGVYADDFPFEGALDNPVHDWSTSNPWGPVSKIVTDLEDDTLPAVSFVDGRANVDDEHPTADVQIGEAWTRRIYEAAVASKVWSSTAILLTYDEAGGFADHVAPSNKTCLARPADAAFFELGVRVPFLAISPWARRHYVSHLQKSHTSITRFVEAVFGLPALTARDANSDGLLDMFDFDCAPADVPVAPAAGDEGLRRGCHPHGREVDLRFRRADHDRVRERARQPGGHDRCLPARRLAAGNRHPLELLRDRQPDGHRAGHD